MEPLTIDIGCGTDKHPDARYGVDILPLPGVDFVCNLESGTLPFAESSVDVVYTRHTLEHIANLEHILREIVRIVKPGGRVNVTVPHFSNTLGYSDYTHKRFFGYYTFDYFSSERNKYWGVPRYTNDIVFKITSKRLCFKNLSLLGPLCEWIFNSGQLLAYAYESKLAWLLPCFEIEFRLVVEKTPNGTVP